MSPLDASRGESVMPIEWTNQHGCGENNDTDPTKCNCNIVIQMMCQPHDDNDPAPSESTKDMMRDGTSTARQDYQNPKRDGKNEKNSMRRKLSGFGGFCKKSPNYPVPAKFY